MSVTLESTGVRFPDNSIQTTAASGGGATTGLNEVGSYAFVYITTSSTVTPGGTVSGSSLYYAGSSDNTNASGAYYYSTTRPSGTWRVMGYFKPTSGYPQTSAKMTLCVRIS